MDGSRKDVSTQLLAHILTGSTKGTHPKGAILNTREKHL